ncbi:MAG: hypothetical protein QOH11_547 [Solirubrobacteraceae bacterium]|nr:hypothetical protein [Solirubrobacteraceae bacterium]
MSRNARAEAEERLAGRYDARVLEPSPPPVTEGPWFADDPVARGEGAGDRPVVSPVGNGDLRWDDLAQDDPELAAWCADRWLGAHRHLGPAPTTLAETRESLHSVGERVVSKAREHANGKIALRYTRGGFGTPFFGDDVQVRVEGTELVVQEGADERRAPIVTLRAAGELIGAHLLPDDLELDDAPLAIDAGAARFLGDWYGFAYSVLEELRSGADAALEPTRVQLWPEHFDASVELGSEAGGRRAGYGASPGDGEHPEPYLYVTPWAPPPEGKLWNATAFRGADLPLAELLDADDQRTTALDFLRVRLDALLAS